MTGRDDRPELINVWNTSTNTRGYAITQLASIFNPDINSGSPFYAVETYRQGRVSNAAGHRPLAGEPLPGVSLRNLDKETGVPLAAGEEALLGFPKMRIDGPFGKPQSTPGEVIVLCAVALRFTFRVHYCRNS